MTQWPFHPGELEAQVRAGGGSRGGAIRSAMPDQHRAFFEALPFVVVGSIEPGAPGDAGGWPVATIWTGAPGFVAVPDAETLRFAVTLDPSDPATRAFVAGAPFGLLGIELATRRRNRANGVIAVADARGVVVAVLQSFGNCPQYIHPRELQRVAPGPGAGAGAGAPGAPNATERFDGLDDGAAQAIARADTFFVATAARIDEPTGGVDVSHRGGPPGFVRVDRNVLTIPDFKGNRYFNTLGNLVSEPRAALLFIDFATGDLLHLQGTTEIIWDGPEVRALDGAERLWRVRVERGWRQPAALPLRWVEIASAAGCDAPAGSAARPGR
jgi:predicted pyridoxine 5'-phosphate oxidase superfamily flavin-nucleotide-binding protein